MMRLLFKFCIVFFLICLIAPPVITFFFCIDKIPVVDQNQSLTFDNVKKVKKIIKDNKPDKFSQKQIKRMEINENELNLLYSYAISHWIDTKYLFAKAKLSNTIVDSFITIQLPEPLSRNFINCRIALRPNHNFLIIDTFQIGRLKIPSLITDPLIAGMHRVFLKTDLYQSLWENIQAIKKVSIMDKTLYFYYTLDYVMLNDLKEKSRSFFIPEAQQQRLIAYHNHLVQLTKTQSSQKNALIDLIKGMFAFAEEKSGTSGNPILENTAAVQVLSLYGAGHRLDRLLKPEYKKSINRPVRTKLLLHNRTDLPKHFLISAALTVSADSRFANLVGLAKEIDDADGGSGFSFADLAADKAGVKFGELAVLSKESARLFQKRIHLLDDESELMPSISNLPEGIMELEFKRKYNDLDSAEYKLINNEINKRLNLCRLYSL